MRSLIADLLFVLLLLLWLTTSYSPENKTTHFQIRAYFVSFSRVLNHDASVQIYFPLYRKAFKNVFKAKHTKSKMYNIMTYTLYERCRWHVGLLYIFKIFIRKLQEWAFMFNSWASMFPKSAINSIIDLQMSKHVSVYISTSR